MMRLGAEWIRKRIRNPFVLCAILLWAVLSAVGCGRFSEQHSEEQPEIRVGMIVDMRNLDRKHLHRVAELVKAEVADQGGIELGGRRHRLVLFIEDVQTPDEAVVAARRLVFHQGVVALVGPNLSRSAHRVGTLAESVRIPMITPASTHPQVTADRDFVFRVSFTDPGQSRALAHFIWEERGVETAAVLFDVTQDYSRDISNRFREAFEELGGQVTALEQYTSGAEDFRPQLRRIGATRPQVLFLPNFDSDVRLQAEQAAELGLEIPFLGSDAWTPENLAALSLLEGAFLTQHWHLDLAATNEETRRFVAAYRQSFAVDPFAMTALNYDAYGLLFDALRRAGTMEPEALRNALAQIEDFRGTTGTFNFRGRGGDPAKPICILQIRDGKVGLHGLINF